MPVRKRFGQHFLEAPWVEKLIRAIDPQPDETFLEIGPGRGALTRPLSARARHVIAFEIDRDLSAGLREERRPNVTVVEGDFLQVAAAGLREALTGADNPASIRVAANLPYNVASPILFELVRLKAAGVPITDATVMLQREVADRLLARPGTKEYGVLTVLIGHQAAIDRVFNLPPGAFRPAPRVHSSVVRLRFHGPVPPARNEETFARLVQAIFTRRRKTLTNALQAFAPAARLGPALALAQAGLDGRRRPETLTIPELVHLADTFG